MSSQRPEALFVAEEREVIFASSHEGASFATCPLCNMRCSASNPSCGKGRAYFNGRGV